MNETEKKLILQEYERIESLYRQYMYAKEISDSYLKKYFEALQKLPMFNAPHQKLMKGFTDENK